MAGTSVVRDLGQLKARIKTRSKALAAYEITESFKDKHTFWCESCHRHGSEYMFDYASLVMGLSVCMECLKCKTKIPASDRLTSKYASARMARPKDITMIAFDIETVWSSPFEITQMAMVTDDGLNSVVIERMPTYGWTIKTKYESKPATTKFTESRRKALYAIPKFCGAVSRSKGEDVIVVMHNGVGFDLPVFMHSCKIESVVLPEFRILDTLVIAYLGKNKRSSPASLRALFEYLFTSSHSYKAHCAYDDACMTMMSLWAMVEGKANSTAKILQKIKFSESAKIASLALSESSASYVSKYLSLCTAKLADSFECKIPTKIKDAPKCKLSAPY